jgi:peptide/nickel transport system permease protein
MLRFAIRRVAMLVAALLVSSFVIFGSLDLAPGDPLATLSGGRTLPPEAVAQLRAQYHLDDPFLSRYVHWIGDVVLHGNLGTSIAYRESVSSVISARAGVTFDLVLYAALLIVLFGVGLGIVSGLKKGWLDTSILTVTTVFAAVPSFVAAIALLSVFSVNLGWFPALGAGEGGFADGLKHLTLPAVALALSAMAIVVRVTRTTVRAELGQEHVQTAVSRGIPYPQVVRRHVLRNAAIPVTTVVGITITSLIALSAVVERAFSLDGLGAALVQAALSKDFAVVQGIALVFVAAFVVANAVVDLLYAFLDPRVALGSRAA